MRLIRCTAVLPRFPQRSPWNCVDVNWFLLRESEVQLKTRTDHFAALPWVAYLRWLSLSDETSATMKAHLPLQPYDVTIKYGALAVFVAQCAITEFARDVGEQVVVAGTTHLTGPAGTAVLLCIRYPRPHSTVQCLGSLLGIRTIADGSLVVCYTCTRLSSCLGACRVWFGFSLDENVRRLASRNAARIRTTYTHHAKQRHALGEHSPRAECGLVQPR